MLKSLSVSTMAAAVLALAAPAAYAQAKKKPAPAPSPMMEAPTSSGAVGAGDTELNFFGSLSDNDAGLTTILLGLGFGKYVSDDLVLKLTQTLILADSDLPGAEGSAFIYSPYGSAEYQIRPNPGSPFVAFVGGGMGITLGALESGGSDLFLYSLFLTPVGGVKYFLNERTAVTYTLSYQFPLVEEVCDDIDCYESETTALQNTIGFSIYY